MTLHDEILSRQDCTEALALRDCAAIANILSAGRKRVGNFSIGYGTVLEALGADAGAAFLDGLTALAATSSPVKWALKLLDLGELNIGSTATRTQLDALVTAGQVPQDVADKLKALALVDDLVSAEQVAYAMFNTDGSLK